jgi:two-component system, cell cycle sensor histidine kinase and response regulator CckA
MSCILLVDDQEESRSVLRELLEGAGYSVMLARDGSEALDRAKERLPDLVISDLLMPVMDGYTLLRVWRGDERLRRIPFVVHTATFKDPEDERLALDFGADAFLLKPASVGQLLTEVRRLLASEGVARTGSAVPGDGGGGKETEFERYSRVLVRKLEEKARRLEELTRRQGEEIEARKESEEELRQVNAAVRKSADELARAQRMAHLGSWEVDLEQRLLEWSEETYRIFGRTPGEFRPSNEAFFDSIHPEDRGRVAGAAAAAVESGHPYSIEHRIVLPDGSVRMVHEHADVLLDAAGRPERMVGTVQDVTELKAVEAASRQSEERFRSLIENAQDLITLVRLDGTILFQSPACGRVLGYRPEEVVGQNAFEMIHPDDRGEAQAALARAADGSRPPEMTEFRFRHSDGGWRVMEAIGKRLVGEDPPLLVINSRDITERRRLEAQFRQSQKMEAIGLLAGGVAHDFNNLLTVIQMNASLLTAEGMAAARVSDYGRQILQAAERAAGLTRQLLLFGRKQVVRLVRLDLNDVISNLLRMLRRILGEDIKLRFESALELPLVQADAGMMEQVLLNLAVNSRDAMPGGGALTILTAPRWVDEEYVRRRADAAVGLAVCVTVSDTGCGIPSEVLPRVFDPFFTTKEVGRGTGLGLATVYGIVQQHRGWIEVESVAGRGTTFRILLPAVEGRAESVRAGDAPAVLPRGDETLLVVEDEVGLREVVTEQLRRLGYTVFEAGSGAEALEVWREHGSRVELLLTDLIMPGGLTGHELAARLRADRPSLAVLFTTGYNPDAAGALEAFGAEGLVLRKPFDPVELARAIRRSLDLFRSC